MLVEANKVVKASNIYKYPWIGTVVDNKDPKKLGRVKVIIEGFLEGKVDDLPWVTMESPTGFGGTGEDSSFTVPVMGAKLNIHFPYDDIYFPVYRGFYRSMETKQTSFDDNYPHKFGFQAGDNKVVMDREQKTVEIETAAGVKIMISASGDLEIIGPTKINIKAPEISFNQKMSGITTAQSHFNVVDFITGIQCVPSLTTFGDV